MNHNLFNVEAAPNQKQWICGHRAVDKIHFMSRNGKICIFSSTLPWLTGEIKRHGEKTVVDIVGMSLRHPPKDRPFVKKTLEYHLASNHVTEPLFPYLASSYDHWSKTHRVDMYVILPDEDYEVLGYSLDENDEKIFSVKVRAPFIVDLPEGERATVYEVKLRRVIIGGVIQKKEDENVIDVLQKLYNLVPWTSKGSDQEVQQEAQRILQENGRSL